MCGIALIISGVQINLHSLIPNHCSVSPHVPTQSLFTDGDIRVALERRGPDSLGTKSVYLDSNVSSHGTKCDQAVEGLEGSSSRSGELRFFGSTLQLRGVNSVVQPLTDGDGNVLVYNGEIFGGIDVGRESNDTEILMQSLRQCCSCISHEDVVPSCCSGGTQSSVPELLTRIKGPWALIYWQDSSRTLWFGRDALGRRSLVIHWPSPHDSRLLLSSVSPSSSKYHIDVHDQEGKDELNFWEELPCGIYSISMTHCEMDGYPTGEMRKHEWPDAELQKLITWERTAIQPKPEHLTLSQKVPTMLNEIITSFSSEGSPLNPASEVPYKVLIALKESVMRRTIWNRTIKASPTNHGQQMYSPISVLFSGGLDSMIIAALLHQCIDAEYEIDLLNVSFDGESAPDRISARAGLKELQKNAPLRRWNLVEIDADLHKLASETKHVMSLINPAKTFMDLNIGIALWLAAGGDGYLCEEMKGADNAGCHRVEHKSKARILLVGSGADEQCAGYGRHRTKFRNGSWLGLHQEMKLDMQRIWKRNLGRDDRCIADNGKEARFPFLDEDVIRILLDIPLWDIADLGQPSGIGDKKILREVARLLNLHEAASLPKRAIQFGSRIARESNRKNFGSNRAANQASAGSVVIYRPSN